MIKLRDYQEELISRARESFRAKNRRILLQSPTGSGKGVIAAYFAHTAAARGSTCLLVVHRREIVLQLADHLRSFGLNPSIIMASADVHADSGCAVASIQTLHARMKRGRGHPKADFVFIDEAHRSSATSYAWLIQAYPDAVHVGLTATPCRQDDKPLSGYWQDLICGPQIPDLIARGHLAEVAMMTLPADALDLKSVKRSRGDYNEAELGLMLGKSVLVDDIVGKWKKHGNNNQTVAFASTVEHSKAIVRSFNEAGIRAAHLDGMMGVQERERKLNALRDGSIKVLSNCMVLTEGFDLPAVKTVIIARPTKSKSLYLQMAGRALRPFEGKRCVILDHACCWHEHGPVDQNWEWSLTQTAKKSDAQTPGRRCPQCGFVNDIRTVQCTECGQDLTVAVVREPTGPQIVSGDLVEVTGAAKRQELKLTHEKLWLALWADAIAAGYKDGWVYVKFREATGLEPYDCKLFPPPVAEAAYPHLHEKAKIQRANYVVRAVGMERQHRAKWAAKIDAEVAACNGMHS